MKQSHIFSIAFIAVLMVLAVSCTPLQQSQGGGYEEAPGNSRVMRTAPFGNNQVIVVERDPFTGQYYQVSPYGYYGGTPYYTNPGSYGYGYPAYPGNSGGVYYRGNDRVTSRPLPQQPERRSSPTTQRAKDQIRGN